MQETTPLWWRLEGGSAAAGVDFSAFCAVSQRPFVSADTPAAWATHTRQLFPEKFAYARARELCPSWSAPVAGAVTASALFPGISGLSFVSSLMNCKPELALRSRLPRVPGFNGELRTMGDMKMFDGAATHVCLDMARSFFTNWEVGSAEPSAANQWLFHTRPPLGFAVVGAPPVAWVVAVEWVGRLFLSAFSQPFFLGSESHTSAIHALPSPTFDPPIDLTAVAGQKIWVSDDRRQVWWTISASEGSFYKLKHWGAVLPEFQMRMALAYLAYDAALASAASSSPPPASLCRAELLFGCGMLAVRMPFQHGRNPTLDELYSPSPNDVADLFTPMANALVWLALHDLLYTDLRPPNIVISPDPSRAGRKKLCLVDYDDMRVVPGLGDRLRSGGGILALSNAFGAHTNESNFANALFPALNAAIETALLEALNVPVGAVGAAVQASAVPPDSAGAASSSGIGGASVADDGDAEVASRPPAEKRGRYETK